MTSDGSDAACLTAAVVCGLLTVQVSVSGRGDVCRCNVDGSRTGVHIIKYDNGSGCSTDHLNLTMCQLVPAAHCCFHCHMQEGAFRSLQHPLQGAWRG
jgi:hypothetical protein